MCIYTRTAGYDPTLVILEITVLPIILCSYLCVTKRLVTNNKYV